MPEAPTGQHNQQTQSEAISPAAWQHACVLLQRAQHVVLVTHEYPDGDGTGSMIGMYLALRSLGKQATMVCPTPLPRDLLQMPHADQCLTLTDLSKLPNAPDLLMTFDAANLNRMGRLYEESQSFFTSLPIINVDHHLTSTRYGTVNLVDPRAAATAELVHRLLELLHIEPTPDAATALMTALVTDTLGFQTQSVTPHTLRLAAHLLEHGAPLSEITYWAFRAKRFQALRLWGYALLHMQRTPDGHVLWTAIPRSVREELGADESDLVGLAAFMLGVEEASVIIVAWEVHARETRFSFRSRREDVSKIATRLGGGGNPRAAGATLLAPLESAVQQALEAALAYLSAPVER